MCNIASMDEGTVTVWFRNNFPLHQSPHCSTTNVRSRHGSLSSSSGSFIATFASRVGHLVSIVLLVGFGSIVAPCGVAAVGIRCQETALRVSTQIRHNGQLNIIWCCVCILGWSRSWLSTTTKNDAIAVWIVLCSEPVRKKPASRPERSDQLNLTCHRTNYNTWALELPIEYYTLTDRFLCLTSIA